MKHFFLTIYFIVCIIGAACAVPLRYSVTHYTTEDGLSQNTVMYIMQDKKGLCGLLHGTD